MLNKKVEEALNKQMNSEFYSAYLYLAMSAYLKNLNLTGFAHWMRIQAMEESTHALKLLDYVLERGGKAKFEDIKNVNTKWKNLVEVFAESLEHERGVSKMFNEIVDIVMKEKDNATYNMLQWFVNEQVEEEAKAEEILQQLKFIKGEGHGVLLIDRELKARIFVDSTKPTTA